MNLPNVLTVGRILVTPLFIILLFYDHPYAKSWALLIFVAAMLTDIFDGYYARKYNLVTDYGRFLDPLADKIMVLSALISFAVMDVIPYWMVSLIIFRDVFVTGLRMAISSKNKTMVTSKIAKRKTLSQVFIIIYILFNIGFNSLTISWIEEAILFSRQYELIYYLTLLVTTFTVFTGFTYLYTNRLVIKQFIS
jgi:CDP-diacylglycerol--glycerol-3-phosphate 3-phosphatidyltransferase